LGKEIDHLEDLSIDERYYKKFWEELIAYFPRYDTGHIENDASNNSSFEEYHLLGNDAA
jgi:hypothetical protein